jgi:DNA adenine methylase
MDSSDSPLKWVGSKRLLKRQICHYIPGDHDVYAEPFAGSASVFFFKNSTRLGNTPKPSKIEVLNDIDGLLMNFYRVIQDPETFNEFMHRLDEGIVARELFMAYRASEWASLDPVERAFRLYYIVKTSYGGLFRFNKDGKCNSPFASTPDKKARAFLFKTEPLLAAHRRLQGVILQELDYKAVIDMYDSPATFFYLDPPYLCDYAYNKPFDHDELLDVCNNIKGRFLLSLNAGFKEKFSGFEIAEELKVNYSVTCKAGNNQWPEILIQSNPR